LRDNVSEAACPTEGDFLVPHCMVSPHHSLGPVPRVEMILQVLCQWDTSIRENLSSITGLKNSSTERSLRAYSQINTLNDDLVAFTADLADLQAGRGVEYSISELKRFHGVVDAYGTTIVEIVRRKEFFV